MSISVFSKNLKELRLEKKLTQKQLAQKLNVTEDSIGYWERGKSEPSISQIIQLSDIFEVTTDFLLGKTEY